MSNNQYPEIVVKSAKDLQTAFKQNADLDNEIKEMQDAVKKTPEYLAIQEVKKQIKTFEKSNTQLKSLKDQLKVKQDMLHNTSEYVDLKEVKEQKKTYQDSIKHSARTMAQEILGAKLADEEIDNGEE